MQRNELKWRGETLYYASKPVASLEADETYPWMYRYKLWDGWQSGLLNLSRAKDGAVMDVMYHLKTSSYGSVKPVQGKARSLRTRGARFERLFALASEKSERFVS
jgi:hypothetical protein